MRVDKKTRRQEYHQRRSHTGPAPGSTGSVPGSTGSVPGSTVGSQVQRVKSRMAALSAEPSSGASVTIDKRNDQIETLGDGESGSLRRRMVRLERSRERRAERRANAERQSRCRGLTEANSVEDSNIHRLETLLGMKRRKRGKAADAKLPASFSHDGLDYILDATDSEKMAEEVRVRSNTKLCTGVDTLIHSRSDDDESDAQSREEPLQSDAESVESEGESGESDEESGTGSQCDGPDHEESGSAGDATEDDDEKRNTKKRRNESERSATGQTDGVRSSRRKDEVWEDIYGRLRDKSGNVIERKPGVYLPPALRAKQLGESEHQQQKQAAAAAELRRRLQGLLNRLSASSLRLQVQLAEQLYRQHSRHEVSDLLTQLIHECCVSSAAVLCDRFLAEHALFVAALHSTVGSEIGGHFLQKTVVKLDSVLTLSSPSSSSSGTSGDGDETTTTTVKDPHAEDCDDDERTDKTADNLVALLAYLYCFQVMDVTLLGDLVRRLSDRCSGLDIRLLLVLLRCCGFQLRRRQPLQLRQLLQLVQSRCTAVLQTASAVKLHSRIRFMLDALLAIRNNNMSKMRDYDPELTAGLQQLLKTTVKAAAAGADPAANQLSVGLDDLLNAEVSGKWWVVGSAWNTAASKAAPTAQKPDQQLPQTEFSQQLLQLARKHHMNTDLRRNVFCILMSSEDYIHAFERLVALGVRGVLPCRQLVSVVLHCALHERRYNPFYCLLLEKMCKANRRYQLYVRMGLEERLTDCDGLCTSSSSVRKTPDFVDHSSSVRVSSRGAILARLVAELIWRGALTLTLLQALDLSELDAARVAVLRLTLVQVLARAAAEAGPSNQQLSEAKQLVAVFSRSSGAKLRAFRNSLVLFMRHFMSSEQMAPLVADCSSDVTLTSLNQSVELAVSSLKSCDRNDDDNLF